MSKELEALNIITHYDTEIDGEKMNITYQEYLKAYTIIEEALKRDEPMKVINGRTINGVCLDYYCPSCKQEIDNSEYSKDQHYLIKYCISCGQALDWGDKK